MLKVLQINAVCGISSTGRTTMELNEALVEAGIESFVATAKTNKQADNLYIIGNKFDYKIHGFCSRFFGTQGYFSYLSTKKLLKFMSREKPDIIHLRNLHGNYINLPLLLKFIAKKDIATVITLHDFWLMTGHCCHYFDVDCDKWKTVCDKCPSLKKWNKSWFFDRSKKVFLDKKKYFSNIKRLAIIGVSDWVTNEANQSFLGNAKIVKRIYNWIDLDIFKPTKSEVRETLGLNNDFVVLGVSQKWSEAKGLAVFVEVANRLPDIKFVLVGCMPENICLPKNIISVGEVNNTAELVKYYSMADVFLNPSIQETFGKTTAEAIASGTPVIGYNLTATPELVGDRCGIVIETGVDNVVNAITAIKSRTKEYYTNNCRLFAEENFSKNKLTKEYIDLYKDLLK